MFSDKKSVIAVVDDDPSVLEAMGNLLESAGYFVVCFNSATNFLDGGQIATIDCLISDIGMPDMDGVTLQSEVGRERPDLPVILITGRGEPATLATLSPNNRGLFHKPFDVQRLLDTLEFVIKNVGNASSN